ncbi:MAG: hypothetical protein HUU57_15500 [Bdellovibrio sp.]|nr:hypothetical protein [Bdellovibrio sp.]
MDLQECKKIITLELAKIGLGMDEKIEMPSLDMVTAAVHLERVFAIRFELDEISTVNFRSLDALAALIYKKKALTETR